MASHPRRGGVKFVLLHHGACAGDRFHYRIAADGEVGAALEEAERGQHARSIGVVVDGDFDVEPPTDPQIDALKEAPADPSSCAIRMSSSVRIDRSAAERRQRAPGAGSR